MYITKSVFVTVSVLVVFLVVSLLSGWQMFVLMIVYGSLIGLFGARGRCEICKKRLWFLWRPWVGVATYSLVNKGEALHLKCIDASHPDEKVREWKAGFVRKYPFAFGFLGKFCRTWMDFERR